MRERALSGLLGAADPDPCAYLNRAGGANVVLTCEHAGRAVPASLGDLGVERDEMDRHIAYDIGAEVLARRLSAELDAALVLQRYSRLVVDCNRPFEAAALTPVLSDGTVIGANVGLGEDERRKRYDAIHRPYHETIARHLDTRAPALLVAVHSFTPRMNGRDRPWHAGLLHGRDDRAAAAFMRALAAAEPALCLAMNEPYRVDPAEDYTVPVHGEARGIAHVLVEVRNDMLADDEGQAQWTTLLAHAVRHALDLFEPG